MCLCEFGCDLIKVACINIWKDVRYFFPLFPPIMGELAEISRAEFDGVGSAPDRI
jgi:hypothetical protein